VFTEFIGKGSTSPAQLSARFNQWRDKAIEYRVVRLARAQAELQRLRIKYAIQPSSAEKLREFLPISFQENPSGGDEASGRDYRLRLVQAKTAFPDELNNHPIRTFAPLAVWLCRDEDGVIAELYEHPHIYAWGESPEDAVIQMLMLMHGYYRDLTDTQPETPVLQRLFRFLQHVFR
jgi:hypothetical protein